LRQRKGLATKENETMATRGLRVSVRKRWRSWSAFMPWEEFVRAYAEHSERQRRDIILNTDNVQCIRDDDTIASPDDLGAALDAYDAEAFEQLQTAVDFEMYLRHNPLGKFRALAERKAHDLGSRGRSNAATAETPGVYEWRVFLSHAHSDKEQVRRLANALRAEGITCWLDEEQIRPGDSIPQKIENGLQRSKRVAVCLSRAFSASRWVRAEYGPFIADEISRDAGARVIPVVLDDQLDDQSVPMLLRAKLRIRYNDPREWQEFLTTLRE
jgi:hypothetical protein